MAPPIMRPPRDSGGHIMLLGQPPSQWGPRLVSSSLTIMSTPGIGLSLSVSVSEKYVTRHSSHYCGQVLLYEKHTKLPLQIEIINARLIKGLPEVCQRNLSQNGRTSACFGRRLCFLSPRMPKIPTWSKNTVSVSCPPILYVSNSN
jgi:hypothetical protein